MGFEIDDADVFTPVVAALQYLQARPDRRCQLLVNPAIVPAFHVAEDADTIVLGDMGEGFSFGVLNRAFRRLHAGAELVALAKNPFWFDSGGPTLDCGAFAAALEFASGRSSVVVGKPNPLFFELGLAKLGVDRAEVAVVGDDVSTDVAGAAAAQMESVLLRTGNSCLAI